jgi:hypothetical protein
VINPNLRTTLQLEPTELAAFLAEDALLATPVTERQTVPVKYADISDILFQDAMSGLDSDDFQIESYEVML